jgi:hypothetical protein
MAEGAAAVGARRKAAELSRGPGPTMPTIRPELAAPHITGGAGHHDRRHHVPMAPPDAWEASWGKRRRYAGTDPTMVPSALAGIRNPSQKVPRRRPGLVWRRAACRGKVGRNKATILASCSRLRDADHTR